MVHIASAAEKKMARSPVAIITPIHLLPLKSEERISIHHLRTYLGDFDRYVIGLENLPPDLGDFKLQRFHPHYFGSIRDYSRLLLSSHFYRAFDRYEYILVYQPDCLVFSSDLDRWCRSGWDYVGAPWLNDLNDPSAGFSAVGNGGLSLRKVAAAIAVLESWAWRVYDAKTRASQVQRFNGNERIKRIADPILQILFRAGYRNNHRWLMKEFARHGWNEDAFWGHFAQKRLDNFRIPSPREALEFSFEIAPRYCFEQNSRRLPFGCHAWARYDRAFWEPYLLT